MPTTDHMPTAAKFVAAICLGVVGWMTSQAIRPLMPPQTQFGWFNEVNLGLGVLCGWVVIGKRVGFGLSPAISAGLTGTGALVVWGLFLQSFNLMLANALQRQYDGPMEAIVAIFGIALDYGQYLLNVNVIAILLIGGVVTGLVAEAVQRRFK